MTKHEFNKEWQLKVRDPWEKAGHAGMENWYNFAERSVRLLTHDAMRYMIGNPDVGSWLQDAAEMELAFEKVMLKGEDYE